MGYVGVGAGAPVFRVMRELLENPQWCPGRKGVQAERVSRQKVRDCSLGFTRCVRNRLPVVIFLGFPDRASCTSFAMLFDLRILDSSVGRVALLTFGLLALSCRSNGCAGSSARPIGNVNVTMAAASDLSPVLREVGASYERTTGEPIDFVFASTGSLAQQLIAGAPFDAFGSASTAFAERVVASGACLRPTAGVRIMGRLALVGSSDTAALKTAERIAIANPEHAPYGVAAVEALTALDPGHAPDSRLVYADNVQAALTLFEIKAVPLAIVSASLVYGRSDMVLLDRTLHKPIEQTILECGKSHRARAFLSYLNGDVGRAAFAKFYFTVEARP
jgi:molybdate transport system substrate-binding protein